MQAPGSLVDVEHQLLQTALFLFAVTDKEQNVLTCNKLFQSTFAKNSAGYFKNEVFVQAVNKQSAEQHGNTIIDDEYIHPDSKQRWHIHWELTSLRNEKAEVTGFSFLGTYRVSEKEKDTANYLQAGLLEQISDAVISTDVDFRIVSFNSAAEEIYHIKKEDAIGKRTDILNHQYEQTSTELAAKELFEQNCWSGEAYFIRKSDQAKIYIHSIVCTVFDSEKNKIGYVAVNRDISKLRVSQQQVTSQVHLQIDYLEAFAPGVIIQDKKGKILFCNSASEKILGFTKERILEVSSFDLIWRCVKEDFSPFPGSDQPATLCMQTGMPVQNAVMGVFKPDESLTWININANPVFNKEGNIEAAVIVFTDVTAERNAFLKLEAYEKRMHTALSKVGDNAWEHNLMTNQIWFSQSVNPFIGYTEEEFQMALERGTDLWWRQTHNDDREMLIQNDREYKAGIRDSHSLEYRIVNKDGTMRWVLDRGVVIEWDKDGRPVRIVGTHTDITAEKKLRLEAMKQKEQKRKDIMEAVLQAQEKEREYIANELHEGAAQVLASVKMIVDRAASNPSNSAEELYVASEKITSVVNELKSISQNINTSSLKMLGLTQAISDFVESASIISDIQFHLDLSSFDYSVEIDYPVQLALLRIVQEKVRNIIRHSGAVNAHIKLIVLNGLVELTINDDGVGFDMDQIKWGLGFKNIYSRAEQYNGNVNINSSKGNGCKIEVKLPVSANRRPDKQSAA